MKVFEKRIIWALGWGLLTTINEFIYHILNGYKYEYEFFSAMVILSIWFIPLLFMKDD